jgi:hypothetical protein
MNGKMTKSAGPQLEKGDYRKENEKDGMTEDQLKELRESAEEAVQDRIEAPYELWYLWEPYIAVELKKAGRRGVEKGDYLTIVAGNAEIIVKHDDDGVAVDIWPLEDAKTDGPLGSTWVTHNELKGYEC